MPKLVGLRDNLPAKILDAISTFESSGIQDSGSSTLSRIGILGSVNLAPVNFTEILPLADDGIVLHAVAGLSIGNHFYEVRLTCSY
jgi:hypothetical protein